MTLIMVSLYPLKEEIEAGARDYWTIQAMSKYGGSFVKALAEAARRADPANLAKIKKAWPEYWSEYEKDGKELESSTV